MPSHSRDDDSQFTDPRLYQDPDPVMRHGTGAHRRQYLHKKHEELGKTKDVERNCLKPKPTHSSTNSSRWDVRTSSVGPTILDDELDEPVTRVVAALGATAASSHSFSALDKEETSSSSSPPLSPFRTAIYNFSTEWFLVPQGTGITSVVLYQLDNRFPGLDVISYIIWAFTDVTLVLMLLIYSLRVALFTRRVSFLLATDVGEIACLSSISIAFTSVNQMLALVAASTSDQDMTSSSGWGMVTVVFWWINMVMGVSSMFFIPYAFANVQPPKIKNLAPSTQLPMVAAITLAAGGGVVAGSLGRPDGSLSGSITSIQVPIVFVSYLSLALAMPIAMAYGTMYLVRLLNGSPPAVGKVYQEMIHCGPWGQGSFALQVLGHTMVRSAAEFAAYMGGDVLTESSVSVLGYSSMFMGFLSWGQGTWWWFFASASCLHHHVQAWRERSERTGETGDGRRIGDSGGGDDKPGRESYSLTAWALVFPWGVYTNAAVYLGKILESSAFRIWSTVLTVCLVILMFGNLALTTRGIWNGNLLKTHGRSRARSWTRGQRGTVAEELNGRQGHYFG